ncbi:MAG: hypothetical protein VB138_04110 [Burkholderia sp.]
MDAQQRPRQLGCRRSPGTPRFALAPGSLARLQARRPGHQLLLDRLPARVDALALQALHRAGQRDARHAQADGARQLEQPPAPLATRIAAPVRQQVEAAEPGTASDRIEQHRARRLERHTPPRAHSYTPRKARPNATASTGE